jgi:hypothetical protein
MSEELVAQLKEEVEEKSKKLRAKAERAQLLEQETEKNQAEAQQLIGSINTLNGLISKLLPKPDEEAPSEPVTGDHDVESATS